MASHPGRIPPLAAVAIVSILVVPCARTAGEPLRGLEPADLYAIRTVGSIEVAPDSSLLAYTVDEAVEDANAFRSTLRVMDLDGRNDRALSRKGSDDHRPRFSPDGQRLAFLSDRGDDPQIYTAPSGSSRAKRITNVAGGVDSCEWSPDGKSFVFVRQDPPAAATETATRGPAPRVPNEDAELAPYVITRTQIQKDGEG